MRLYDYQRYCVKRIIEQPNIGLFLDMGMGKSVITLTAINQLMYDYFSVKKVLVIAPLEPARSTWPEEIKKWKHLENLTYSLVLGSLGDRRDALRAAADIFIVNRENVPWVVQELHGEWPFDMVVVDELSSFKNNTSLRFKQLKKIRSKIKRFVGLTGTPAPNGLLNLWPQVYLLDRGKALGRTMTSYRDAYFLPDQRGPSGQVWSWRLRENAKEQILDRLQGLCISMDSEDFLDLPETMYIQHQIKMSPELKAKYKALKHDMVLDEGISAATAAVLSNKLLQFSSGAIYSDDGPVEEIHSLKLDKLDELIEEANGQPVLVFYTYKHELERIKKRFPEIVSIKEPDAIERWNRREISILAANPASAGHGLNLQFGGHIIIWFGMTWDLELYKQANKRLSRPGQKYPVLIHHITISETIDTRIAQNVLKQKENLQNEVLSAVKVLREELSDA